PTSGTAPPRSTESARQDRKLHHVPASASAVLPANDATDSEPMTCATSDHSLTTTTPSRATTASSSTPLTARRSVGARACRAPTELGGSRGVCTKCTLPASVVSHGRRRKVTMVGSVELCSATLTEYQGKRDTWSDISWVEMGREDVPAAGAAAPGIPAPSPPSPLQPAESRPLPSAHPGTGPGVTTGHRDDDRPGAGPAVVAA